MRRLSVTFPALVVTTLFGAPAIAHHSHAMFDASQFSPGSETCDDDVAARYRDHVPE
jgi:hypothetical protein